MDIPEVKKFSSEETHALFKNLLESCSAPAVVELRSRLTPQSNLIARPFYWILVEKPWYRNRVLLIGDAAHATTAHMGMGGAMAVEDSVVLAQSICNAKNLEEAFEQFMERRFERVKVVVKRSLSISQLS